MDSEPSDDSPHDSPEYPDRDKQSAGLETDDRFPSGPWIGYYQQWNTQARQRLVLTFKPDLPASADESISHTGSITGGGRDPGGQFLVKGSYDTGSGKVELSKVYDGHLVEYTGIHTGDGIEGNWVIRYQLGPDDRGIFHIWPDASGMGEGMRRAKEEPVCVALGPPAGNSELGAAWPG